MLGDNLENCGPIFNGIQMTLKGLLKSLEVKLNPTLQLEKQVNVAEKSILSYSCLEHGPLS